jgi:ABC-type phosphate/phosphonate transport system substrate-binding protein
VDPHDKEKDGTGAIMAKQRTVKLFWAVCAAALLAALAAPGRNLALAQNGQKVVFAINMPISLLGAGASDIISEFSDLKKAIRGKYHVTVDMKMYRDWNEVARALNGGQADVAWLPPYQYARHKARNSNTSVAPLAVYESSGKTESQTCLFVSRDKGPRTLDHLIGKRVAFADEGAWVVLNKIFEKQDYPFRPADFFGSHEEITRESAALALVLHEVDAIVLEKNYAGYIERDRNVRPFGSRVRALACAPAMTNAIMVSGKNLTGKKRERVQTILFALHRDKAFSRFREYFKISDGRWAAPGKNTAGDWRDLYEEALKKGWIKDYERLGRE